MPNIPRFSYYIAPRQTPLSSASAVWRESLPLARPTSGRPDPIVVSHGQYFEAARSFFEQDGCATLSGVLARRLEQTVLPGDIHDIRIHLEKHGEFYHPARIEAVVGGHTIPFVLNIAVSDSGKQQIHAEFHTLKRLNAEFAESFLPQVYTLGQVAPGARSKFSMFLGEWFPDYHEFHITRQPPNNQHPVCVWDDRNGHYCLSGAQTLQLYRQAARIMTAYYNLKTFEHISPWHHAAGDFIVKRDRDQIDLKLITVRGYAPLFHAPNDQRPGEPNTEQILQALLIFFLKLSIRMRLDRIDGIGEMVWSNPGVVPSTVQGVLDGLAQKPADPILPDTVDTCFKYYLSICSPEDLFELAESMSQTLHPAAPETPLIRQHLAEHVQLLFQAINAS